MFPHIRGQRSRRSPIALAMATLLLLLAPSAAGAVTPAWLDPQAGWHGRAIERPLPTRTEGVLPASGSAVLTVSTGDGLGTANGSPQVRRVQRILRQLGYGTGPVDGRFGPRTRSALAWFQVKHGLAVDGVAGPQTLQRLRERAGAGAGAEGRNGDADAQQAPAAAPDEDAQAAPASRPQTGDATGTADPGDRWLVAAIAVGAILVATLIGLLLRRRRRGDEGTVVSLAKPLWVAGTSSDPAIGRFSGTAAALHVSAPATDADAQPAIRYCVIDDDSGAAVWVSPQDIQESRGLDERRRRQAADAVAGHSVSPPGGRFSRPAARPRRGGSAGRPRPRLDAASQVERRVTWFRSLGMPPEAIADLLKEEGQPPPESHRTWTAEAVASVGTAQDKAPAAIGQPAEAGGPTDGKEGRSD